MTQALAPHRFAFTDVQFRFAVGLLEATARHRAAAKPKVVSEELVLHRGKPRKQADVDFYQRFGDNRWTPRER